MNRQEFEQQEKEIENKYEKRSRRIKTLTMAGLILGGATMLYSGLGGDNLIDLPPFQTNPYRKTPEVQMHERLSDIVQDLNRARFDLTEKLYNIKWEKIGQTADKYLESAKVLRNSIDKLSEERDKLTLTENYKANSRISDKNISTFFYMFIPGLLITVASGVFGTNALKDNKQNAWIAQQRQRYERK